MNETPTLQVNEITAIILAGGAGRRAGGRDKGLVEWSGKPLVAHVADRLRAQCRTLLISCNRNQESYARFGSVVEDRLTGYQGPLAGLHGAAPHILTGYTLVCPCDVPRVPRTLATRLAPALLTSGLPVAYVRDAAQEHYLCALLRSDCLATLSGFLEGGGRAVREWYGQVGSIAVDIHDAGDAFANINQPD